MSHAYAINRNEFHLASCLRLELHMPFSNWIAQCECSKDVDKEGFTYLPANIICYMEVDRFGSTTLFCHVGVNVLINTSFKYFTTKPQNRYAESENRPDIVLLIRSLGKILNWTFLWHIIGVLMPSNNRTGKWLCSTEEEKNKKNTNKKFC